MGAKSTVLTQMYLSLGVDTVREMTRLSIVNLGSTLTGSSFNTAVTTSRNQTRHLDQEKCQKYLFHKKMVL